MKEIYDLFKTGINAIMRVIIVGFIMMLLSDAGMSFDDEGKLILWVFYIWIFIPLFDIILISKKIVMTKGKKGK